MTEDALNLQVIPAGDDDDGDLADLAARLGEELRDLDVDSVEKIPVADPDGTKGLGTLLGALAVHIGEAEPLATVLLKVGAWARRADRTVEVEIRGSKLKLGNVTAEEQARIIDNWLAQHAPGS